MKIKCTYNNGFKRQKGIALLGLMIAMGFISTLFVLSANGIAKKQVYDQQALPFKDRLIELQKALENYQIYQHNKGVNLASKNIFPSDRSLDVFYSDLADAGVTASCTQLKESEGKCVRLLTTPWAEGTSGNTVKYESKTETSSSGVSFPFVEITFDLPNASIYPNENAVYEMLLSSMPNTEIISSSSAGSVNYPAKIKWRIDRVSDMPALDIKLSEFGKDYVNINGRTKLTSDWDLGDKAITNASDISIRLENGKQQRLGVGMTGYVLAQHGDTINKHSCATGLIPDLIVSVKDLNASTPWSKYSASGAYFVTHLKNETPTEWKITLEHNVQRVEDKKWWMINDGWLNVQRICRK